VIGVQAYFYLIIYDLTGSLNPYQSTTPEAERTERNNLSFRIYFILITSLDKLEKQFIN
jgi:hypothetical protein